MCTSIGSDAITYGQSVGRSFDGMGGGASKTVRAQAEPGHEGQTPFDPANRDYVGFRLLCSAS